MELDRGNRCLNFKCCGRCGFESSTDEEEASPLYFCKGVGLAFHVVPPSWAGVKDFGNHTSEVESSEVSLA